MASQAVSAARLSDLPDDISESFLPYSPSLRQRQRATLFSKGQYINCVKIWQAGEEKFDVFAGVFRSQAKTDSPHQVNVTLDGKQKNIPDAFCTCKAGISGQCAHVLALMYTLRDWILAGLKDVPSDTACTSLPQQWDKPRGPKITAEPVSTMVIAKPGKTNRKRKPVTAVFKDNRKSQLAPNLLYLRTVFSNSSIGYLAQDCEQTISTTQGPQLLSSTLATQIPLISQAITAPSQVSLHCGDINFPKPSPIPVPASVLGQQKEWSHLNLTLEEAKAIEQNTSGQVLSTVWQAERKKRLTASQFGRFMLRKTPITDSFLNMIFFAKPFVSAPTTYGTSNEKVARQMYIKQSQLHVHECGLVINPSFPFLGASPDGKVCDADNTGIIEIKCPYSIRDMTIAEAVASVEKSHLVFFEKSGDTFQLKRKHLHWYQVQGQLLITGAPFCDFICYTRVDLHVERIYPDIQTMTEVLTRLTDTYVNHVKKYLSDTNTSSKSTI